MGKLVDYMNLVMKHFLNLILAILTAAVFAQVVFRFVLESPLAWTEELAIYCLVWLTFLGAAYALALKAHIGVDFFVKLFPLFFRKIFYTLAAIISMAFYLILVIQGYDLVIQSIDQLSPVLRISVGWVYSVIPISGVFLLINLIYLFIKDMKSGGKAI